MQRMPEHKESSLNTYPTFEPVHPESSSTGKKSSYIRKKLSKLGLSSSEVNLSRDQTEEENNRPLIEQDDEDDIGSPSNGFTKPEIKISNSMDDAEIPTLSADTTDPHSSSSGGKMDTKKHQTSTTHKIMQKLNHSTHSLTGIIPPPNLNKRKSTVSLNGYPSRHESPNRNANGYNAPKIPSKVYSSPSKNGSLNGRYLATNNDHSFITAANHNHTNNNMSLPMPPTLPRTSSSSSSKHSPSGSVSLSNPSSSDSENPKPLTASSLPQFVPVNITQAASGVLLPPTALAPIHKTVSGVSHKSSNSASNINVPGSSRADSTSQSSCYKRNAGLLQAVYRSTHKGDDISDNSDINTNETDSHPSANTNTNLRQGSYQNFHQADREFFSDHKEYTVSPNIINEFLNLKKSFQAGIKKRMELLEKENENLVSRIKQNNERLNNVHAQLAEQLDEIKNYIELVNEKKDNEVKNLYMEGISEKLSDLSARIDTVKKQMVINKSSVKLFDKKLTTIEKIRISNKARNKYIKLLLTIAASVIFLVFLILKFFGFNLVHFSIY